MKNWLELIRCGFVWEVDVLHANGRISQHERVHNLLPDEMAAHMAGVVFRASAQAPTWYLAPYEGNYTPLANITAATFAATALECLAYAETTRVEWVEAGSGGALTNSASLALFTMNAAKTVYGGALLSSPTKAGTTGVIGSCVRFPSPKILEPTDVLRISAGMAFSN
jgi:hypothetical protein